MSAGVSSGWRLATVAGCVVALGLAFFTRGHLSGSDELNLYETTRSLVEQGTLAIPPVPNARTGADGRIYSLYSVGPAVLAMPFYWAGRAAEAALPSSVTRALAGEPMKRGVRVWGGETSIFSVMLIGPAFAGLVVALFLAIQRELGVSPRSALVASLLLGATTHLALLSSYLLRHLFEGAAVLAGFLLLLRWRHSGRRSQLFWGTLCASLTLLARLPAALAAVGFAVWVAPVLLGRLRSLPRAEKIRELAALAAPVAIVLAAHMVSNWVRWERVLFSPMTDEQSRFPYAFWYAAWGFLLSPGFSIFAFSPLLLLLPWAFPGFFRRHPDEARMTLVVFGSFVLVFSFYDGWTGLWAAPGPRYLFVPMLLLMLPLGGWLDDHATGRARAAAVLLAAIGLFVQISLLTTHMGEIAALHGWPDFVPQWGFLFVPDGSSPIPAAASAMLSGTHLDTWVIRLARGWPGYLAAPGAALGVTLAWLVGLTTLVVYLRRVLLEEAAAGRQEGSGGDGSRPRRP